MRYLRIISDKIHDNIIYNLADFGNTPNNYLESHLNTGYLIQIIASLDKERISEWQFKLKGKCPELTRRIDLTAKLWMDGYARSFEHSIASYHSITVWLDAYIYMIRDFWVDTSIYSDDSTVWKDKAANLFDKMIRSLDIRNMSTLDLSRFVKSLSLIQQLGINVSKDDILIESSLELLYRINKFGFFCSYSYDQSTLPLSKQFFVLDCLLECSQITGLEIIICDALKVFNNLDSMARKNPTGHFTFRRGETLAYSTESIGNISMGLSAVLLWLKDTNERKSIMQTLEELYFKLLSNRLTDKKSTVINTADSHLLLKGDIATHISESLKSLLADRILLNFSEQSVKYRTHRPLNDWQTLYLCRCLLDVVKRVKLLQKSYL